MPNAVGIMLLLVLAVTCKEVEMMPEEEDKASV